MTVAYIQTFMIYRPISSKVGVMIETTKLYILIPV